MRNEHYVKAQAAVKTLNTKAGTLFGSLLAFVVSTSYNDGTLPAKGTDIKPVFKTEEQASLVEAKVTMGDNSTYRVVKNLLVNCVAAGIDIRKKGKTQLEHELAETKVPKSDIEKFKAQMVAATNIAKRLPANERIVASALVSDLLKETSNGIALAA